MASAGSGDGEPEFQIAPMIDVLLVLLVFFVMISSAQVLRVDRELTLPVSPNAKPRDTEMAKHEMIVNVRWDQPADKGVLVVNEKIYEQWDELIPLLERRIENDPTLRIVIRGDKGLPAMEVQRIMGVLAEAGISDIAFASSNR